MSNVDIFLLCTMGLGLLAGYRWGIVSMVFSIAGIVASVWVISHFATQIHDVVNLLDNYGETLFMTACVLIVVVSLLIGRAGSWFAEKVLKLVLMNWINKGIGAFTGLIFMVFFLSFVAYTARRVPADSPLVKQEKVQGSKLYPVFEKAGSYLPGIRWVELYHKIIPQQQQSPEA